MEQARVCPKCGKTYTARPAISRFDNQMEICPLCGTREALDIAGVADETKTEIIAAIADYENKNKR